MQLFVCFLVCFSLSFEKRSRKLSKFALHRFSFLAIFEPPKRLISVTINIKTKLSLGNVHQSEATTLPNHYTTPEGSDSVDVHILQPTPHSNIAKLSWSNKNMEPCYEQSSDHVIIPDRRRGLSTCVISAPAAGFRKQWAMKGNWWIDNS